MKWQPIETAPRNGTTVLLYRPKHKAKPPAIWAGVELKERLGSGHYDNGWLWGGHVRDGSPTHWMPMPDPPEDT